MNFAKCYKEKRKYQNKNQIKTYRVGQSTVVVRSAANELVEVILFLLDDLPALGALRSVFSRQSDILCGQTQKKEEKQTGNDTFFLRKVLTRLVNTANSRAITTNQ